MRRIAIAIVFAVIAAPSVAHSDQPATKKDRERAAKSPHRGDPPRVGGAPARLVNLYNSWTHEWLAVAEGEQLPPGQLDRFLRDHYTNSPRAMEPRLLGILLSAAKHFHRDRVLIISGYRHPKFNLLLRKKGHQVARDSHHTQGDAVDFQLPGITVMQLHQWASDQKIGGVGLYRESGFVHMDTGPVRHWEGE